MWRIDGIGHPHAYQRQDRSNSLIQASLSRRGVWLLCDEHQWSEHLGVHQEARRGYPRRRRSRHNSSVATHARLGCNDIRESLSDDHADEGESHHQLQCGGSVDCLTATGGLHVATRTPAEAWPLLFLAFSRQQHNKINVNNRKMNFSPLISFCGRKRRPVNDEKCLHNQCHWTTCSQWMLLWLKWRRRWWSSSQQQ